MVMQIASKEVRGQRLKTARENLALSQAAAGRFGDTDNSLVSRWELGGAPDLQDVQVAIGLGLSPNQYLLAEPYEEANPLHGLSGADALIVRAFMDCLRDLEKMQKKANPQSESVFSITGKFIASVHKTVVSGATIPEPPSSSPAGASDKFGPLQLPEPERDAFLQWILGQAALMPAERPLTKAIRVVATRVARDNDPAWSAKHPGKARANTDAGGKAAPRPKAREPLPDRQKQPVSVSPSKRPPA